MSKKYSNTYNLISNTPDQSYTHSFKFLQQISGLLLAAKNCAGPEHILAPRVLLHILEQGTVSGQVNYKS